VHSQIITFPESCCWTLAEGHSGDLSVRGFAPKNDDHGCIEDGLLALAASTDESPVTYQVSKNSKPSSFILKINKIFY
tara:strand:- start:1635 stop:1868 length:234 start_codon:yes stop_codon:yes gene_type:complete